MTMARSQLVDVSGTRWYRRTSAEGGLRYTLRAASISESTHQSRRCGNQHELVGADGLVSEIHSAVAGVFTRSTHHHQHPRSAIQTTQPL
jgi:hypothetical protein